MLLFVGPNGVRVLRKIGVLDEILKKINPKEVRNRGFWFYDGLSYSSEPFFKVCPSGLERKIT